MYLEIGHVAVAMLYISEKSTGQSIDNQRSAMFDCRKYNFFLLFFAYFYLI